MQISTCAFLVLVKLQSHYLEEGVEDFEDLFLYED